MDAFYEGENMLVIHPDECIGCGACEPECPAEAILPDTEGDMSKWVEFNRDYSERWPNITRNVTPPADADEWNGQSDKMAYFSPEPGSFSSLDDYYSSSRKYYTASGEVTEIKNFSKTKKSPKQEVECRKLRRYAGRITLVTDQSFTRNVSQARLPVLLLFGAGWCRPCMQILPALKSAAHDFDKKLVVAFMNVDQSPMTPSNYGVRGVPTSMLFKHGQVTATKVGALPCNKFKQWVEAVL